MTQKYRPGTGALKEIRFYQKEYELSCSKIAVARLIREKCDEEKTGLRWQVAAILALHEAFEDYLVNLFTNCVLEAIHGRQVTVMPKDIHITRRICGETDTYKATGAIRMRNVKRKDQGDGNTGGNKRPKLKPKKKKRRIISEETDEDSDGNPIY